MTKVRKELSVIISGGSRGLGLEFVKFCLSENCKVATFARSETNAVKELTMENPDRFIFKELDVTDIKQTTAFVGRVAKKYGTVDALINNAAIGQDHLLSHLSPEKAEQILQINLLAPILLTRAVIKKMILAGGGQVINISSICSTRGFPGLSAYSATKGGIESFTRSLSRELGERKILINSIAPGFFSSEMSEVLTDDQMKSIVRRTPTGQLCVAEDIIPVLSFLLFENTNCTGQIYQIDGGASV
ncbi:MAG: short-chain dehydrogenase [Flavobacteriaceae bacterium]|nr:short-chain dehydrogenase [Flavobacteriaceae bacterium]